MAPVGAPGVPKGAAEMFGSVEEARSRARKRLPAAVFHYIDGGKEAEQATVANEAAVVAEYSAGVRALIADAGR